MPQRLHVVHFSPSGTTRKTAEYLAKGMCEAGDTWDMLKNPSQAALEMGAEDALLLVMPVFAGRIPGQCLEGLKKLHGNGRPAIAVAVYGNRAVEDALLEMADLLADQGFVMVGAAAFCAQHSIFTAVGAGRPDAADMEQMDRFRDLCVDKLKNPGQAVSVPGNRPYRQPGRIPLKPKGSGKCNNCGVCVKLCPVGAIDAANARVTDKNLCITCTACIHACPQGARKLGGLLYWYAGRKFTKAHAGRKEPAFFI